MFRTSSNTGMSLFSSSSRTSIALLVGVTKKIFRNKSVTWRRIHEKCSTEFPTTLLLLWLMHRQRSYSTSSTDVPRSCRSDNVAANKDMIFLSFPVLWGPIVHSWAVEVVYSDWIARFEAELWRWNTLDLHPEVVRPCPVVFFHFVHRFKQCYRGVASMYECFQTARSC